MSAEAPALVDVEWLRRHLDDTVVLDASIDRIEDERGRVRFGPGRAAFAGRRIPGARLADLFAAFSDPDGAFPFTLPAPEHLRDAARAVGVDDLSRVVVYDRNGGAWAARVWWLLRTHGHRNVSVLDGGLTAWEAAGSPVTRGAPDTPTPAGGPLTLRSPESAATATLPEIALIARGEQPGLLVCGVRRSEFEGDGSRPRSGHIPGSASLPYRELFDADGLFDFEVVRERAAALGLDGRGDADTTAIVYCGGGINAAGLVLALTAAGFPAPRLYDGSLNEWRADHSLPMAVGAGIVPVPRADGASVSHHDGRGD